LDAVESRSKGQKVIDMTLLTKTMITREIQDHFEVVFVYNVAYIPCPTSQLQGDVWKYKGTSEMMTPLIHIVY